MLADTDIPQDCQQPQSFLLGPQYIVISGPKRHPDHVLRDMNSPVQEALGVL